MGGAGDQVGVVLCVELVTRWVWSCVELVTRWVGSNVGGAGDQVGVA